jgi:hypothetical protein
MEAPMLPRRRNTLRRRVLKTGFIEFPDNVIECTVRDMSEVGRRDETLGAPSSSHNFLHYIRADLDGSAIVAPLRRLASEFADKAITNDGFFGHPLRVLLQLLNREFMDFSSGCHFFARLATQWHF